VLCDPHRAIGAGPSRLKGALMTSPDIRAGMAMLLAAVCAEGVSAINNADQTNAAMSVSTNGSTHSAPKSPVCRRE
jgi:UDP-N-acetylglucosamine enolpyruvyl transferase